MGSKISCPQKEMCFNFPVNKASLSPLYLLALVSTTLRPLSFDSSDLLLTSVMSCLIACVNYHCSHMALKCVLDASTVITLHWIWLLHPIFKLTKTSCLFARKMCF